MTEYMVEPKAWFYIDQFLTIWSLIWSLLLPILLYVFRRKIRDFLYKRSYVIKDETLNEFPYDGLILTLSNNELPLYQLKTVQPTHCVVITSLEMSDRCRDAQHFCAANNIVYQKMLIEDSNSVLDTKVHLENAFNVLVQGCNEIAFDVTGGTKPMGIAAFNVATEKGCDCLYTQQVSKNSKTIPLGIKRISD